MSFRNNTNFPTEVRDLLRGVQKEKGDVLRYHQKLVLTFFQNYDARGMLFYHKMGAGKTILSVAVASLMIEKGYRICFLANKSLHDNFKGTVRKYAELTKNPDNLDKYDFVSMNAYNMYEQIKKLVQPKLDKVLDDEVIDATNKFDKYCLVVDEAHNLFNSISNGSKNALGLYRLIMKSKCRLLFLTGSPITNNPFESAMCFNMLAGRLEGGTTLFSENYNDFTKYFVEKNMLHNKAKYTNRISGLVTYYGADDESFKKLIPKKLETQIIKVKMGDYQYKEYEMARKQEIEEEIRTRGIVVKGPMGRDRGGSSSYLVGSRQISNFAYPKGAIKREYFGVTKVTITRYPERIKPDHLKWPELGNLSTKLQALLEKIQDHTNKKFVDYHITKPRKVNIGPGLVYSQFVESGLMIIGKSLNEHGWVPVESLDGALKASKNGRLAYAEISGRVPMEVRKQLVDIYNSEANSYGEQIALLLVSSTGAEGLDLKGIRHIHIYEPYWHIERINQVFGRGVRLGSHMHLPEKDRTVNPYIYLSITPLKSSDPTTDENLYQQSLNTERLIVSFLDAIKQTSIDCSMHYGHIDGFCKLCMPTNRKLFLENLTADMNAPNACQPIRDVSIEANEIMVEGKKYLHKKDDTGLYIFEKDGDVWQEITPNHPDYMDIVMNIT
jgi:hypothetical protein